MSVGVMEDYKLRDLRASHTLGWSWKKVCSDWTLDNKLTEFVYLQLE
jgi:hypothetical protein